MEQESKEQISSFNNNRRTSVKYHGTNGYRFWCSYVLCAHSVPCIRLLYWFLDQQSQDKKPYDIYEHNTFAVFVCCSASESRVSPAKNYAIHLDAKQRTPGALFLFFMRRSQSSIFIHTHYTKTFTYVIFSSLLFSLSLFRDPSSKTAECCKLGCVHVGLSTKTINRNLCGVFVHIFICHFLSLQIELNSMCTL